MSYVLEITDDNGEIKYVSTGTATVYCPEYASRYEDQKSAMTVGTTLIKNGRFSCFEVRQLSCELCLKAYKRNRARSFFLTYPDNFK